LIWALSLGLAALLAVSGCSNESTPVGGTGGGTVVAGLIVSADSADIGATVIVEATVENTSSVPQAGVWVTFSVSPAGAGTFTADSAQTDANGIASTIFNPSSAGSAAISAEISSGSRQSQPLTVTTPGGGQTGSGLVSVAISPTLMQADGTTEATVTITAFTPASDPVPDSTPIRLAAGEWFIDVDGNGYFTPVWDTLKIDYNANGLWDAIGQIPAVAYTTGGVATVTYTAGSIAGTVYLLATVGDPGSSYSNSATLSLTPNDSVANIELYATWADIQVHGTGGTDFTEITAACFDAFGNPAPEGLPVALSIISGPGGGEGINGTVGQPVSKLTDGAGRVTWTVASGTVSGTIRIRATAGTVLSTAIHVVVNAGPPFEISLGAASCNVQAWHWVNLVNPIVAVVVDAYGNPVPAGTAVYFSTEEGSVGAYDVTEEDGGVANVEWRSGDPKNDGIVWIWAETSGGTVFDSVAFISSGPAASITYLSAPASIAASSDAKAKLVLEVLDVNGNFVVEVTPVDMFTDFGSVTSSITADGCHYSLCEVDFVSTAPREDHSPVSPDDGIVAVANVVARSGMIWATWPINLLSGPAYFRNSTMDYFGEMVVGATVPVEVTIKDRNDIPLGGHVVSLTATAGSVSGSPAVTDRYGIATFSYTAPADTSVAQSAYLTATDSDPRGGITVAKKVDFVTAVRPNPGDEPGIATRVSFNDQ
jgi:adhesin/invasin